MPAMAAAKALKAADEDRWLSAQFAATGLRERLHALFLIYHAIARVPAAVTEPKLGEIRLQWWREALAAAAVGAGPAGEPALAAARDSGLFTLLPPDAFEPLLDAHVRLLYDQNFAGVTALAVWLEDAEGALAMLALRLAGLGGSPQPAALETRARQAAATYGLCRFGAGYVEDAQGLAEAITTRLPGCAAFFASLDATAQSAALYLALAPLYRPGAAPAGLTKRWVLFRSFLSGKMIRVRL